MSAQASTAGLLLRHELRLQWRTFGHKKLSAGLIVGAAFVVMHLIALPLAFLLPHMPSPPRVALLAGVSGVLLVVLLTMISTALVAAVKAIHTRGDFDLLLSSPVTPRAVILVRTAGIAVSHFAFAALLVAPFANMAALFGHPRFLVAYPVLMCLALISASTGLLLVQGLFRLMGAHRTRIVTQVIAGIVTFATVVLAQIPNMTSGGTAWSAYRWFVQASVTLPGETSLLWLPARAAVGEPIALTIALLVSLALFVLTTRGLAQRFVDSATAAAGITASPKANVKAKVARPFRGGPTVVLRRKEWRLLARDPWLLTQVAQQMVFLLPLVFLMWKGHSAAMPIVWLAVVLLAGTLAGNLAWLTMSAEDAPDLITSAPLSRAQVLRAKLEATLLPVAAIMALPVAFAAFTSPWLGFTLLVCATGAALSCATVHVRMPAPGKRSEFNQRGKGRPMAVFAEMIVATLWALIAALMLWHPLGALLPLLLALAAVAVLAAG